MAMAVSKVSIACSFLLISSLFLEALVEADNVSGATKEYAGGITPAMKIDCGAACAFRCSLSSRPNLCHRACGTCCARCGCVPPGTSGNYEVCPCYANLTTHGGRRKCP